MFVERDGRRGAIARAQDAVVPHRKSQKHHGGGSEPPRRNSGKPGQGSEDDGRAEDHQTRAGQARIQTPALIECQAAAVEPRLILGRWSRQPASPLEPSSLPKSRSGARIARREERAIGNL